MLPGHDGVKMGRAAVTLKQKTTEFLTDKEGRAMLGETAAKLLGIKL